MDQKLYIELLHKILYCFKFRNNEDFDEYKTIVFSPLYKQLFKETRTEMKRLAQKEYIENKDEVNIKDRAEEYNRVIAIIKGSDFANDLTEEIKKELIDIIVYPFSITEDDEKLFLELFPA